MFYAYYFLVWTHTLVIQDTHRCLAGHDKIVHISSRPMQTYTPILPYNFPLKDK